MEGKRHPKVRWKPVRKVQNLGREPRTEDKEDFFPAVVQKEKHFLSTVLSSKWVRKVQNLGLEPRTEDKEEKGALCKALLGFVAAIVLAIGGCLGGAHFRVVPDCMYLCAIGLFAVLTADFWIICRITRDKRTFWLGKIAFWLCSIVLVGASVLFLFGWLPYQPPIDLGWSDMEVVTETPDHLPGVRTEVRLQSRHCEWGFSGGLTLLVGPTDGPPQHWRIIETIHVKEEHPDKGEIENAGWAKTNDRGPSQVKLYDGLTDGNTYRVTIFFRPSSDEYLDDQNAVRQFQKDGTKKQKQIDEKRDKWRKYADEWLDELREGVEIEVQQHPE